MDRKTEIDTVEIIKDTQIEYSMRKKEYAKLKAEYDEWSADPKYFFSDPNRYDDRPVNRLNKTLALKSKLKEQGCPIVQRQYPKVTSKKKFNWILAFGPGAICFFGAQIIYVISFLLGSFDTPSVVTVILYTLIVLAIAGTILSPIYLICYILIINPKIKERDVQKILNSFEYQSMCANLDMQYDEMDAQNRIKYDNLMAELDRNISECRSERAEKTKYLGEKLRRKEARFKYCKERLTKLYNDYGKIPVTYRNDEAIQYIYDAMQSSNCSVQEAIVSYERMLDIRAMRREEELRYQHEMEEERERQREYMRQMYEEQYYYSDYERSSGGSFVRDAAAVAVGTAIGNHGIKKELVRQRKAEEEREKKREFEKFCDDIKEDSRRRREEWQQKEREKAERERQLAEERERQRRIRKEKDEEQRRREAERQAEYRRRIRH